jgi:DNA-3-methyladenine glycosylase I
MTVVGEDGLARCGWALSAPEYIAYHDAEWGRPVSDETRIYETLCLEGFQAGLAWITILRKREGFRRAFASFDPAAVARFDDADVARLVSDAAIVRHRGKIEAAITNARATIRLRDQGLSLPALVWRYEPSTPSAAPIPGSTPESRALSKELRHHGFAFVGPTTIYAAMQALGVVNDHAAGCHMRETVAAARSRFVVPT